MAWAMPMSDWELTPLRVMIDLADDLLAVDAPATLMGPGGRQVYCLRRSSSAYGPAALASPNRGCPSKRKHGECFRATVLEPNARTFHRLRTHTGGGKTERTSRSADDDGRRALGRSPPQAAKAQAVFGAFIAPSLIAEIARSSCS
jgi:hypothetical protein